MHDVFLLLGSNLGDRHLFMKQARRYLLKGFSIDCKSNHRFTKRNRGEKTDAPDYLNQVILQKTDLPAQIAQS